MRVAKWKFKDYDKYEPTEHAELGQAMCSALTGLCDLRILNTSDNYRSLDPYPKQNLQVTCDSSTLPKTSWG